MKSCSQPNSFFVYIFAANEYIRFNHSCSGDNYLELFVQSIGKKDQYPISIDAYIARSGYSIVPKT